MKDLTPAKFTTRKPMGSVLQKSEAETVALNIMTILKRTGDKWRKLSWDEYVKERVLDGASQTDLNSPVDYKTGSEKMFFEQVVPYTVDADSAAAFSDSWKFKTVEA